MSDDREMTDPRVSSSGGWTHDQMRRLRDIEEREDRAASTIDLGGGVRIPRAVAWLLPFFGGTTIGGGGATLAGVDLFGLQTRSEVVELRIQVVELRHAAELARVMGCQPAPVSPRE
jgi:hypothetical protein